MIWLSTRWKLLIMVVPTLAFFTVFVTFPVAYSLFYSFTNFGGFGSSDFVGWKNYATLFADPLFWVSFRNTGIILVISVVVLIPLSFALAILMRRPFRGARALRALVFAPGIIAPILVGLIWVFILDSKIGLINQTLQGAGVTQLPQWIGGNTLGPYSIALVFIWSTIGFAMTIFYAGLQLLPADVMEASSLDGAGPFQQTWNIVVPMMKETFGIVTVLVITNVFKIFELVYQLTGGRSGSQVGSSRQLHVLHDLHQPAVWAGNGVRGDHHHPRRSRLHRIPGDSAWPSGGELMSIQKQSRNSVGPGPAYVAAVRAARPTRVRRGRRRIGLYVAGAAANLVTFVILLPLLWIALLSFKPNAAILNDPLSLLSLSWDNYVNVFATVPLGTMYVNTIFLAVTSVTIGTVISFMSSFALTRMIFRRPRVQSALRLYLIGGLAIPIYILLFPVYRIDIALGIFGTYLSLILPYVAVTLPFNTLLLTGFLRDFPRELEEAAIVDGAGLWRLCWSVVLPLMRPVIATVLIFNVIYVFNEYPFVSILINNPSMTTVSLAVSQFQGQYSTDYGAMMAASTIILIPQLVIYAIFQKQVVAGMTVGAVKG